MTGAMVEYSVRRVVHGFDPPRTADQPSEFGTPARIIRRHSFQLPRAESRLPAGNRSHVARTRDFAQDRIQAA
jgi:hypothetical protein